MTQRNTVTVEYKLATDAINTILIETGTRPDATQRVILDLAELTPEQRKIVVDHQMNPDYRASFRSIRLGIVVINNQSAEYGGFLENKPRFEVESALFGMLQTVDAVIENLDRMNREADALLDDLHEAQAVYDENKRAYKDAQDATRLAEEERKLAKIEREEAAAEAKRVAEIAARVRGLHSGEMITEDLWDNLMAAAGLDPDDRFGSHWVKKVTGIDTSRTDGYMFVGEIVDRGTILYKPEISLYLCCSVEGSRKNNTRYFRTVILTENGWLMPANAATDDSASGWAARMRDRIRPILEEVTEQRAAFEAAHAAETPTPIDETGSAAAALELRETALNDAWEIAQALDHDLLTDEMRDDPVAMLSVLNGIARSLMIQIGRSGA